MEGVIFLTLDELLRLHAYQVEHFGGDPALLNEGCCNRRSRGHSKASAGIICTKIWRRWRRISFTSSRITPFVDGNKRTGTHAALVFQAMNGHALTLPVDEGEQLVVRVATGAAEKAEIAAFFRRLMGA